MFHNLVAACEVNSTFNCEKDHCYFSFSQFSILVPWLLLQLAQPWQLNVQYSNIRTPININDNINIDIDPHLIRAPLNVNNVNPNFDFDCLRCKSRCTHETSFESSNPRQSHRALDSI